MSRAADYVPYRFYRICPEDSHTCTDRECLAGSPECPKAAAGKPAPATPPQPPVEYF